MLAILSLLLTTLPPSLTEPLCHNPPPVPSYIPNLDDCQTLVSAIFAISEHQHDEPILWSRHPSASVEHRKLPYSFTDPLASNDCEFIVDALHDESQDTFPTKLIGKAAAAVVEKCMEGGIDGAETLGAVAVGPKLAIAVVLTKKWWMRGGRSEGLDLFNVTNARLLGPGVHSGLNSALVEDG